jgi:hypothetical protein
MSAAPSADEPLPGADALVAIREALDALRQAQLLLLSANSIERLADDVSTFGLHSSNGDTTSRLWTFPSPRERHSSRS